MRYLLPVYKGLVLLGFLFTLQCAYALSRVIVVAAPKIVNHSWTKPNELRIKSMDISLAVDMDHKKIRGSITYTLVEGVDGAKSGNYNLVYLDAKGLNIRGVYSKSNMKTALPWNSALDFKNSRALKYGGGFGNIWMWEKSNVVGSNDSIFGDGLVVMVGKKRTFFVEFETNADAAALQWLSAEQTHDKQKPFLFSQSQAILARTWLPCQDLPSVRFTYTATVVVDAPFNAVMSAEKTGVLYGNLPIDEVGLNVKKGVFKNAYIDFPWSGEGDNYMSWMDYPFASKSKDGGTGFPKLFCYKFSQNRPISSYLMALSVGDFRYVSYRTKLDKNVKETGVYAEIGYLEECRREFGRLPELVKAAEKLYGQYVWGSYRVLVLPPSFPFGGMENPVVTFATPTIIAGDGSLVSLLAHELAHSWSGNLVTNATWEEFWLNEGFTNYFESRIMESVFGKDYADLLVNLAYADLVKTVEEMEQDSQGRLDTRLVLDLENRDPDEGVTDIAYEKGRFLLVMIERNIGRENWDLFLRSYFSRHSFGVVTTQGFLSELHRFLLKGVAFSAPNNWFVPNEIERNPVPSKVDSMDLSIPSVVLPAGELKDYWELKSKFCSDFLSAIKTGWIHGMGLPFEGIAAFPEIESAELLRVDGIASRYWSSGVDNVDLPEVMACELHRGGSTRRRDVGALDTTNFTAHHWVHLLRRLRAMGQLSVNELEAIDERFHLSETKNSEIAFEWFMLALKCQYRSVNPYIEQFLFTVGRRKFVLPLYEQILKTQTNGTDMVSYIFYGASLGYHSVTRKSVVELLRNYKP